MVGQCWVSSFVNWHKWMCLVHECATSKQQWHDNYVLNIWIVSFLRIDWVRWYTDKIYSCCLFMLELFQDIWNNQGVHG